MKGVTRKYMQGKISDALLQFMPDVKQNMRMLIADVVLTEVEREGMLPPTTEVQFEGTDGELYVQLQNKWEEE